MTFRIGQDVVCIKDGEWSPEGLTRSHMPAQFPRKGGVYRIAAFDRAADGRTMLVLEGVVCRCGGDISFDARYFRPVIKRDTSAAVEQLRKLQDPTNHTLLPEDFERAFIEVFEEALR